MTSASATQIPWPLSAILWAWIATGVYFIASMFFTQRIKRREPVPERIIDRVLLIGGYFFVFSEVWIPHMPQRFFMAPRYWLEICGMVITYLGLLLVVWSRIRLGRFWSGVVALKQDHQLIQSGPYRVVRHPLYSGIILAAIGMAGYSVAWSSLLGVALLIMCFERRAHKEDALLAAEFGEKFADYRRRTGRLIPRLG